MLGAAVKNLARAAEVNPLSYAYYSWKQCCVVRVMLCVQKGPDTPCTLLLTD
jgi:hypothetical protein